MAKPIPHQLLKSIEIAINQHPGGAGLDTIASALYVPIPRRTLQYQLKYLVDTQRLITSGAGRGRRYLLNADQPPIRYAINEPPISSVPLSKAAQRIRDKINRPIATRKLVGYNAEFLESYQPNKTAYLSVQERALLHQLGTSTRIEQPAGTIAARILDRLLIDLSWNSSRLEGNTYSLLDTQRLLVFGAQASGTKPLDAQMILNHKDAIKFLVVSAEDIGFNRRTLFNLHALLANNLMPDPSAEGRLRNIPVTIGHSVFHPLEVPALINDYFNQIMVTASAIHDPFEQSFFILVQLPYLQSFEDVNKRVSRLAANIPFIQKNLLPLSFNDVPTELYIAATLGVYELNKIELLKELFLFAYQRSAERYAVVQQTTGEPDLFKLQYQTELRSVIYQIISDNMDRSSSFDYLMHWSLTHIPKEDQPKFERVVEVEIMSLHEGNFARYRVTPLQFEQWQVTWEKTQP